MTANADLSLNTLSHFLDRFVYKNPKKPKPKGSSAMQPGAAASDGTNVRIVKGAHDGEGMMNEEAFRKKKMKDVPVDQVFFHKYFSQKNEKEKAKAAKVAKRKGQAEDEGSDEDLDGDGDDAVEEDGKDGASSVGEGVGSGDSEGEEEIWKVRGPALF